MGANYQVISRRRFRGHQFGETFYAVIDPAAERRALLRGDIRVVDRVQPSLQPGTYGLPEGWLQQEEV